MVTGLKHQKEKRSMDHSAGLDVSVKETSVCIVDDTGKIVREAKVASEPEALLEVLTNPAYHFKRIGLEAGPLSQWLFSGHLPNMPKSTLMTHCMVRPCVARGLRRSAVAVLHQCIRPLIGASRSWPSWISARLRSH